MMNKKIFISHRSTDKKIADMLLDYFASTGLSTDSVFCSSLPGNDVKNKISEEIKQTIKCSALNIIIISNEYYQSAYCLNEEGIIWFIDSPIIVIAMPEIKPSNMLGFIRDEYKLRRLDNENDIAAIYDQIANFFPTERKSISSITHQINKLKEHYFEYLNGKTKEESICIESINGFDDITTDDEKVILYYLISQKIRKVQDDDIKNWLTENEIYGINVANALDLLAVSGWGTLKLGGASNLFEINISHFRTLEKVSNEKKNALKGTVKKYYHPSKLQFKTMWDNNQFDGYDLLFISYIIDEDSSSLGDRWMAAGEIENIKLWESKFGLRNLLSESYSKCLNKFIDNNLVYASSWTEHGNPREYTLHKSIKSFLQSSNFPYTDTLRLNKEENLDTIPF